MLSSAATTPPTFERVYREHFEFVWRTLRALGVRESAVDDAVQDVFIVVHRRLPEFEGRASVRTWTYEIARRVAMRYRTRAARHDARHSDLPPLAARDDLDGALDQAMAADVMKKFLWQLDDDRRQAFVLSEFGELAGREIAETLDVNMNTIYARIRSARTELDRLAKRMHAHDAGAVRRAMRNRRPDPAARRRTWAGLMAITAQAAVGHVAPALAFGTVGWIVAGVAAVGVAVSLAWSEAKPAPKSAPPPKAPEPVVAAATMPPPPTPRPLAAPPPAPPDPPPTPSPATTKRSPTPAPPPTSLKDELEHVRGIRTALRQADHANATARIADYRERFASGSLTADVDALEVELGCTTDARGSKARLEAFLASHPKTALRTRLENACSETIAPQTPSAAGTHPR